MYVLIHWREFTHNSNHFWEVEKIIFRTGGEEASLLLGSFPDQSGSVEEPGRSGPASAEISKWSQIVFRPRLCLSNLKPCLAQSSDVYAANVYSAVCKVLSESDQSRWILCSGRLISLTHIYFLFSCLYIIYIVCVCFFPFVLNYPSYTVTWLDFTDCKNERRETNTLQLNMTQTWT